MKHLLLTISLFTALVSPGQKRILKQAASFEASGLYEQAAEKYMEALYQNATRSESVQGLKRTSQEVVDEMLSNYFIARNANEPKKAVEQFESIVEYNEKLKYFKVQTEIPDYYFTDYESDKAQLVSKQASQIEKEEKTKLATLYEAGIEEFNNQDWVKAWDTFTQVEIRSRSYKEVKVYKDKIRSRATSIAIIPSNQNKFSSEESLRSNLVSDILGLNNPLIKVINRENLDQIIQEQKLGLSGIIDEKSAAKLGKILGVSAVLFTKVIDYHFEEGSLIQTSKTAYSASKNLITDQVAQSSRFVTDYYPHQYQEFSKVNLLQASVQYQIVATETAEILTADIIRAEYSDALEYAEFNGNYHALYPSNGTSIFKSGPERETFLALFSSKRDLMSKKEIEFQIQKLLSKKLLFLSKTISQNE